MINQEKWVSMSSDVKGEIYEGLLQKNAEDVKSGAGQYFTPRPLIRAMVRCIRPQPMKTIADPCCGSGGFFLAAQEYLADPSHYTLDREQKEFLKNQTFYGSELVGPTYKLCLMNLYLHNIGDIYGSVPVTLGDSLLTDPGYRVDYVLTNPPFGKKSSITFTNEQEEQEEEDLVYNRQDFWTTSSNKQLNFVQHINTILNATGKAAVVVPDNVLFEGGAGETVRRKLLETTDLHTILRLPTGIFYKPGVKANVIFFDKRPASPERQTNEVWIYDFRTNVHFTLKQHPMTDADLEDFIACYNPANRHQRTETWSEQNPDGRWRRFSAEDILNRDKCSLDIFWIKDQSLADLDNLPPPGCPRGRYYRKSAKCVGGLSGIDAAVGNANRAVNKNDKGVITVKQEYLTWVAFYTEFAEKLLPYATDRQTLIEKIQAVYTAIGMRLPKLEKDNNIIDIDPFTVFGLFNKGITNANRIAILRGIANEFSVNAPIPKSFDGIPVLNNQKATYYLFIGDRQGDDIENLWRVFVSAMEYAKSHSERSRTTLIESYDAALLQKGIKWNLTMGLYWICPYEYLNLDSRNRWYICNQENMPSNFIDSADNFNTVPSGEKYLQISDKCRDILKKGHYRYKNFPELSYYAWIVSEEMNEENRTSTGAENQRAAVGEAIGDKDIHTTHYWIYSPGNNACMWDEFYDAGIMAIGWGGIGDLTAFATKDAMKQKMKECINPSLSYINAAHATWQFTNDMKPGDIVFVKKGMHRVVGKGVVTSDYMFDASRSDTYKNVRQMHWTNKGEWEHPGQAVMKTLTDITPYTDYVEKLNALFEDENVEEIEEVEVQYPVYTAEDFLNEVYMSERDYQILINLLKNKKNVIMQGAPGVGKTFAAKRLAYSMMGVKDSSRVMMVQFHQSYSYEDFIMGFRPASTGFELKKGPFYSFCKKAETDIENDYFFIIDEINRGNLSKIFGELFMLIENDKRGVPLQLLYSDEKFSVPANVYIIGMMNTADRSLAMLDYALRRRFAFFEFSPAFETEGFRTYRQEKNNKKFDNLIAAIEKLNAAIEDDDTLGRGFRIGHSYFCTENEIDDLWLNAVITYEIIPLLNEYWFDEPSKVHDWEYALREAIR